jgi:hypothetical protein
MPEGILAVHGQGIPPNDARKDLQATDAKRFLMELANLH